jgi:hypothetical protein
VNILLPVVAAAAALSLAVRIYPRIIARVFREDDQNPTPSARGSPTGCDYVKSRSHVVFGHHFATIAGAGPIVGPTLALALGWQPVWLWVVLGGIFFGAVHDMSVMFTSLREGGRSIGSVARRVLGTDGLSAEPGGPDLRADDHQRDLPEPVGRRAHVDVPGRRDGPAAGQTLLATTVDDGSRRRASAASRPRRSS